LKRRPGLIIKIINVLIT